MIRSLKPLVLIVGAGLAVASCDGSRINQSNFDEIETDMTREQVIEILGEPTDSGGVGFGDFSGGMATWEDDAGNVITIQFVNGKVKGKQFSSG